MKIFRVSLPLQLSSEHFLYEKEVPAVSMAALILLDSSLPEVMHITFLGISIVFQFLLFFFPLCLRKGTLKHWNETLGKYILIFFHSPHLTFFSFLLRVDLQSLVYHKGEFICSFSFFTSHSRRETQSCQHRPAASS